MTLKCDIVTQERTVLSREVDAVNVPGAEGRMGILPNHTPLLTTLAFGEVMIRVNGQEEFFAIGGGIVEIQPNHVIILADSAEHADEIDADRAEQARQRVIKLIEDGAVSPDENPDRYVQLQASLARAQIRLDVSRKRQGRRRPTQMDEPVRYNN